MPRDLKNPPSWAKDAVATVKGWCDPKTGELLVSIKGLELPSKPKAEKKVSKKKSIKKKTPTKPKVVEEKKSSVVDKIKNIIS